MDKEELNERIKEQMPMTIRAHEGYTVNLNMRLVPGKDFPIKALSGCQPRQGAPRRNTTAQDLPEPTRKKLEAAHKVMVAWLAQGENTRAFLNDPIAAMKAAGVQLDRADLKALDRTRKEQGEASIVPPGMRMGAVSMRFDASGKVKPVERPDGKGDDCNCKHA